MTERLIRDDGLVLATESFGDSAHPAILLIMGGGASMLWWPEAFCSRLAGHGRYVIRYDQRETGHSTPYIPDGPAFSYVDLVEDTTRILDGYDLPAAHVVGMSFGGLIGQYAALEHPERVRSLTVISSSPAGIDTSHLPGMSEAYLAHLEAAETIDWSDRGQAIAHMLAESRLIAWTAHPFDEAGMRAFIARDHDRSGGYPSASNFNWQGSERWAGRLADLQPPLLVIHGTADPVFPIAHGQELLKIVPGAKLVRIPGGGHELHPDDWDTIISAIAEHTSPANVSSPHASS
jgi:pimeloyl-ACP methyl ester carboxylesterase